MKDTFPKRHKTIFDCFGQKKKKKMSPKKASGHDKFLIQLTHTHKKTILWQRVLKGSKNLWLYFLAVPYHRAYRILFLYIHKKERMSKHSFPWLFSHFTFQEKITITPKFIFILEGYKIKKGMLTWYSYCFNRGES